MPELDLRLLYEEKIPPGTMKEILEHANLGHKGIGLITPATGGDLRCIHPKAISLMTERPLQETEEGPITEKQMKKNENGRRYATYAAYNASHETIILPKNKLVGQCQLILQPSEAAYQQELSAMQKERLMENQEAEENHGGEELSRDWVMDNFRLRDNSIIKANLEVGKKLIRTL